MKFPVTIRHRTSTAKIYAPGGKFAYYRLAYATAGKRRMQTFASYSDAKTAAERIVRELAEGSQAAAFNASQSRDALAALQRLESFRQSTGRAVSLGYSFVRERQVLKIEYTRSVANEIVDGEMEILAAGEWKNFPDGAQNYSVHANAAASLPPGHFQLTKTGNHLRLEWSSDEKRGVGAVIREITIK